MSQRLLKGILSEDNSREDDLLVAFELFSILNMESPPRKSPPNQNHPESPRDRLNNYNSYYIYSPQNRKKCHESALPTSKKDDALPMWKWWQRQKGDGGKNGDMTLTNENSKIKTEFDTFRNVSWKVSWSINIATRCPPNANKEIRFAPFKLFRKL